MKLAAIDIGSNSLHMIIVRATSDHSFEIVDREKDMVKLGAGAFRSGRLDDGAIRAGLATLARYRKLAERFGVDEVIAVATSAVREALNGGDFLDAVKRETGIVANVVSGDEEARLIYLAVRHAIDLTDRRALIVDVGGGSVEVTVGGARELRLSQHLKLGVQRLRDLFGREDPLPAKARKALEAFVRERAEPVLARARDVGFQLAVGTSGSILGLGAAAWLRRGREPWISPNGQVVRAEEVRDLAERLAGLDAAARARLPGVDAQRADTIHLAGLLVATLLEIARAESLTLCECALREGVVLDYLARQADRLRAEEEVPDIRRRSALDLARRSGQAGPHAERVAELALSIFDQTGKIHGLGLPERRLLEDAALIHDVGKHLGFERHEHHGYYMIRNADLRGFTDEEVELMALITRYHRKAMPKRRHREFGSLPRRGRRLVRLLAGILRIAEGLDRSQFQVVRAVRCAVAPDRLEVRAIVDGDAELELWAARRKSALLARALGRDVEIVVDDARVAGGDGSRVGDGGGGGGGTAANGGGSDNGDGDGAAGTDARGDEHHVVAGPTA